MRSWSILFPHIEGLRGFLTGEGKPAVPRALDAWFDPPFVDPTDGDLKNLFKRNLTPEKLERIYFGVEFCQRLIPDSDDVKEAIRVTREAGLNFSYVTPPATDIGVETLMSRFSLLREETDFPGEIEVIVNDWGVLRVLKRQFTGLKPVFGRMMNKMIRDPRVAPYYVSNTAPSEGLTVVRQSSVTNPLFQNSLKEWGVDRHEFDNLFQGIEVKVEAEDIFFSVYVPYGYVATGRVCMPGSFGLQRKDKFTEYMGCGRECQGFTHKLGNAQSPFSNRTLELVQRGNTIFFPNSWAMLKAVFNGDLSEALDRVVYQPGLPI